MGKNEEDKIARARKQLLIIGVVCISAVILTLWVINLRVTLRENRIKYPSSFSTLKSSQEQLKNDFRDFRVNLKTVTK